MNKLDWWQILSLLVSNIKVIQHPTQIYRSNVRKLIAWDSSLLVVYVY